MKTKVNKNQRLTWLNYLLALVLTMVLTGCGVEDVNTVPPAVNAAPTGVAATAGYGQIIVRWNSVPGANSYNLYWSTSSGITKSTGIQIPNVIAPYKHGGRTNETTYYYVVTAVNAGGESTESLQASAVPATPAPGGAWKVMAPMPVATNRTTSSVLGGKIYVLGGYLSSSKTASVYAYDPALDNWGTRAPLPTARCCLGSATVNTTIYAIGGSGSTGAGSSVDAYDPLTDTWTTRAPMPTARSFPTISVVEGEIYVIGGRTGTPFTTATEVYDPNTDTWKILTPVPTNQTVQSGAAVNGAIYVVTYEGMETWRYDPVYDTWSQLTSGPTSNRSGATATAINEKIYFIGGHTGTYLDSVDEYNPATDTWKSGEPMPTPRYIHTASAINGKIYAIGGWNGAMVGAVEEYTLPTTDPNPIREMPLEAGLWENVTYTGGTAKIELLWSMDASGQEKWQVHGWGFCGGGYCDWGIVSGHRLASGEVYAIWDFGWKTTEVWAEMSATQTGKLETYIWDNYSESDGRTDYGKIETYNRVQ